MKSSFRRVALVGDSAGLEMLIDAIPSTQIACIVAASNRPRHHEIIRQLADNLGIPMLVQPPRRDDAFRGFVVALSETGCDSLICNSYSMLLPHDVLALVSHAAFNFHGALLPRNRGANPVQWAIIRGETETGISLHQMEVTQDTGPVLRQQVIPIHFNDTWVDVMRRINDVLPRFVKESIALLFEGKLVPVSQDDKLATSNPRLTEESPLIDFEAMTDEQIRNLVRAQVAPLAGAYLVRDGVKTRFTRLLSLAEIAVLRDQNARSS